AALDEAPDDPGSTQLHELLAELESLLARGYKSSAMVLPSDGQDETPPAESLCSGPRLLALPRPVTSDPRLGPVNKPIPAPTGNDDEIWGDVQRLLLRLPPGVADEWRRRSLQHAEQAGARADTSPVTVLPLPWDEVVYPGLTGAVQAAGLRSSPSA